MLGRMGSLFARQLEHVHVSAVHKVTQDQGFCTSIFTGMKEIHAAQVQNEVDVLSLPEDVFSNIGSWLDDREVWRMELASKVFYDALTRPRGTPRRQLIIKASAEVKEPTAAPARWCRKRIMRYSQITCQDDGAYTLRGSRGVNGTAEPPLLPSLLAACASSTELELSFSLGDKLLAMSSISGVAHHGPELSSFWANLQQHLTSLQIWLHIGNAKAQLDTIGMLTSLRKLTVNYPGNYPHLYTDFSGEKLVLKLPHLAKFSFSCLENGKLILSCPKLAEVTSFCTQAMRIGVEHAVLKSLSLTNCQHIQFAVRSPGSQLHKLETLNVSCSSELGKLIIEDVGQMHYLQTLSYRDFPAACMPKSWPKSLQRLDLRPSSWHGDPPEGLKDLTNLKDLSLFHLIQPWDFTLPWEEFVPTDSLETVTLCCSKYARRYKRGKATFLLVERIRPPWIA